MTVHNIIDDEAVSPGGKATYRAINPFISDVIADYALSSIAYLKVA